MNEAFIIIKTHQGTGIPCTGSCYLAEDQSSRMYTDHINLAKSFWDWKDAYNELKDLKDGGVFKIEPIFIK